MTESRPLSAEPLDAQAFAPDEIEDFWSTHAMDNPGCDTCRWLATITDLGAPGGTLDAARAAITPEAGLDVERLRKAVEVLVLTPVSLGWSDDNQMSEVDWTTEVIAREYGAALRVTPVEGEAGLRAAAHEVVAWSVIEDRGGRYLCRDCHTDVTEPDAPHADDCVFAALRAALSPEEPR